MSRLEPVCDTATTSTIPDPDARALLDGGPGEYIARRDQLAKDRRAAGDKEGAASIKSLSRPTMGMWAVLTAASDTDVVHDALEATDELVRLQATGADRAATTAATTRRRAAMEQIVTLGMTSLGRGSDARAQEVRELVERLTRHPELIEQWLDATLREIPTEGLGFDAFAAYEPPARSGRDTTPTATAPKQTAPAKPRLTIVPDLPSTSEADAAAQRAERERARLEHDRERAARVAAKAAIAAAEKKVTAATRTLEVAQRIKDDADASFERAGEALAQAERHLAAARDAT